MPRGILPKIKNIKKCCYKINMRLALSIIMSFVCAGAIAQICGFVKENAECPLEYANVSFLSVDDSTIVGYAITDSTGYFHIDNINIPGKLKISYLGYKTFVVDVTTDGVLGDIYLQKDENLLSEVTIKAKRFVRSADGLTVNVANTILSKMGNATDVLKHLPFVMIKNKEVNVLGKGIPVIYINNRKLQDFDELKQIQSLDIKKIKIITNPGAEYDATVNAVIRIYTSRSGGEGFGGSVNEVVEAERRISHYGGVSLNYRKGGFDMFGTLRYYQQNFKYKQAESSKYLIWDIEDKERMSGNGTTWNSTFGINYNHKDKLSVGIQYKNTYTPTELFCIESYTDVFKDAALTHSFTSNDKRTDKSQRHYTNAYLNYNFTDETYLQLDADYVDRTNNKKQNYEQFKDGIYTGTESHSKLYAGKLSFIMPFIGGSVKTGVEGVYTHNTNKYSVFGNTSIDNELNNSQNIAKQNLFAVFTEYKRSLDKQWSICAGGRFEYVDFDYMVTDGSKTSKKTTGLFPSASVIYNGNNFQTSLAYRYTTRRPGYFALRSSVEFNNPYSYEGGTPDLQDAKKNLLSFDLSWKDLQLNVTYSFLRNEISFIQDMYQGSDSVTFFHSQNIKHGQELNLSIIYSPTLFEIWNPSLTLDFAKQNKNYNGQTYNKPVFTIELENTLTLPYKFVLGTDITWNTSGNSRDLSYIYDDFCFDAYCLKSFFNEKLHLKLSVSNAFNTSRGESWQKDINAILLDKWCDWGSRTITFSAKYTFNPAKKKYKGEMATDEIKRL